MAQQFPQTFGPYTLHQLIGRGGMAEIYRATMPGIGTFERVVAIKKILPHLTENEEFITMLIDEAQILVGLNHANVAQVYDLGKIDDSYYIAMEYVHGIDISDLIKGLEKRGQYIPYDHTAYIVSCLCMGLHIAHHATDKTGAPLNIVHRDISPHNVLLSFAGDIKVIDFGVAKARSKNTTTQAGVIKGKLLYMAPEQAMAKDIDGRADLFAAGLVMYKMLTRQLPFSGDNEFQIYNNILTKEIVPPKMLNPQIPEELNQICMTLLQREPDKRYQTGYAAKQELTRALHHLKPGYTPSRLSRFIEDNFSDVVQERQRKAAAEAAGVAALAQGAPNTPGPSTPPRQPTPPPAHRPSPWDQPDTGSTVEQPAPNFAAMGLGGQPMQQQQGFGNQPAERLRTHDNAQGMQSNQRTADPGQFATPVPGMENDSGHNAFGERVSTPVNGFENSMGAIPDGLGSMELPVQPLPPEEKKGIPPILFAVLGMGILMTGLIVYMLFFANEPAEVDTNAPVTSVDKTKAPEKSAASQDSVKPSTIAIDLTSEPEGAEIYNGDTLLGTTPLSAKIDAQDFPLSLEIRSEGYKTETFTLEENMPKRALTLAPGDAFANGVEGNETTPTDDPAAGNEEVVEEKPEDKKVEAKTEKKSEDKKVDRSSSKTTDKKTSSKTVRFEDKKVDKKGSKPKDNGFVEIDFGEKKDTKKKDTKPKDSKKDTKKEDDLLGGWD